MDKDRSGKGQGVRGDDALQVGDTKMGNTWTMILSSASHANTRMGETYQYIKVHSFIIITYVSVIIIVSHCCFMFEAGFIIYQYIYGKSIFHK